jgi:hypothetical protein
MEEELCKEGICKMKKRFPVLAVILLLFALVWIFNDLGYIGINIPWIPVILAVVAIGIIVNRYSE